MPSNNPIVFNPNEFSLSEEAIKHFKNKLMSEDGASGIRFSVKENDGCSGYSYEMDYVNNQHALDFRDDIILKYKTFKVFVDNHSFKYLKGTKVDFLIEGVNKGVVFNNPNVSAVCGCGESFDVD
tara:strand:- start:125 stop:499 length:375 start_codon:yes stop_codon:yes gene_type:complete